MTMGPATDKNKVCRKVLVDNFPDRCVFGDVFDFVKSGRTVEKMSLHSHCHCFKHGENCPLFTCDTASRGNPDLPWPARSLKTRLSA